MTRTISFDWKEFCWEDESLPGKRLDYLRPEELVEGDSMLMAKSGFT